MHKGHLKPDHTAQACETAMAHRLRIGIMGAADIARKNCRAIAMTDTVEVAAVASRSKDKAAALLNAMAIERGVAYGSYDDVLRDSTIDAVYIPLPTSLHVEWVHKAAAAGKHILLEKPIALTDEDAAAIAAATADGGVVLMDGTMWMHNPRTAAMRDALASQRALGDVRRAAMTFCFNTDTIPGFENNIRMKKGLDSLGALGDLGWYCTRACLWAMNYEPPSRVVAHHGATFTSDGVPLSMGATMLWSDGRRADFFCSFEMGFVQTLQVFGTLGNLRVDDLVVPTTETQSSFALAINPDKGLADDDTRVTTSVETTTVRLEKPQEAHMWEAFARCIADWKAGNKGGGQHWSHISVLTQRVVNAVLRSAHDNCAPQQL